MSEVDNFVLIETYWNVNGRCTDICLYESAY